MNEWDGEKEITGGDAAGEGVVPDVELDEAGQLCEPDGNGAEEVVEATVVLCPWRAGG